MKPANVKDCNDCHHESYGADDCRRRLGHGVFARSRVTRRGAVLSDEDAKMLR